VEEDEIHDDDYGMYPAKVIDIEDPLGLHRIQFAIPGKMERSGWAIPITSGGGAAQRGGHVMPAVGSDVFVVFLNGDPNTPAYQGGYWGARPTGSEMPADIQAAGADAHLVQAFELGQLGGLAFRVTLDERAGHRSFKIYAVDPADDEVVVSVELDLEKRGLVLYGLTGVELRSDGFVQALAPVIQFNNRALLPRAAPI
jgi:hypothetical protein